MRVLDRYVLTKFLVPFIYCFVGFISIWLVFDLSDNGPDFLEAKVPLKEIGDFYLTQVPEIIVISLPIAQLLALLYSLTQMSRANEIVAMLTAGVSVVRIIIPFFIIGLMLTGVTLYFNMEQSPHAAMIKKQKLREIKVGKKLEKNVTGHLFRNREDYRTWFMYKILPAKQYLQNVEIIQQDAAGKIMDQWYVRDAYFNPEKKVWLFQDVKYVHLNEHGEIEKTTFERKMEISNWSETPWRISSSTMNPDYLSVRELREYLKYNADFPPRRLAPYLTHSYYRWSLPWICLLVVFIAAPLGIVYTRRGILGGVSGAIGLFFSLIFFSSLFITLGKGGKIDALVAAWGPLSVYMLIGLLLLWMKSTNREFPKIPGL